VKAEITREVLVATVASQAGKPYTVRPLPAAYGYAVFKNQQERVHRGPSGSLGSTIIMSLADRAPPFAVDYTARRACTLAVPTL
jgi:hypothetical protein